ncbi:MAG: hypothetical protein [Caudoviricetes sp.]|nr:MAG: hypothetical protein [Caudoviricetes sp.]
MSTDEMQENEKIVEILSEIRSDIRLINEKIKQVDGIDERVTVLERNESRNEGGVSTVKTIGTIFGALFISALGWLYQTTYKNNNDVLLLLQRVGNLEQVIHDAHK